MSSTKKKHDEDSEDESEMSFFESLDRIPSSVSFNFRLASTRSRYEDASRLSFSSAIGVYSDEEEEEEETNEYELWMEEPISMSVEERRYRLRQEMGLSVCNRAGFSTSPIIDAPTDISMTKEKISTPKIKTTETPEPISNSSQIAGSSSILDVRETMKEGDDIGEIERTTSSASNGTDNVESGETPRSNTDEETRVMEAGLENDEGKFDKVITVRKEIVSECDGETSVIYTISDLNTGKDYILNMENGNWNCTRVCDTHNGVQLTMDEFHKSVGHSPIVKELMRRECDGELKSTADDDDTTNTTSTPIARVTPTPTATTTEPATMTTASDTKMSIPSATSPSAATSAATPTATATTTATASPTATATTTATASPTATATTIATATTATTETTGKKKKKKIKGVSWLKNIKVVATSMTGSSSSSTSSTTVTADKEPKSSSTAPTVDINKEAKVCSPSSRSVEKDSKSSPSSRSVEKDPKNSPTSDKEKSPTSISPSSTEKTSTGAKSTSPHHTDWMKVRRRGKPFKELTGLYMSQEIEAHEGSIWCMAFSSDGVFLASAGEDGVIHVWQVLECDSLSSSQRPLTNDSAVQQLPQQQDGEINPTTSSDDAAQSQTQNLKNGKSFLPGKNNSIPENVVVPETIFSLSEKPFCTFDGHVDDVLCLSWSKSQSLLSSSMDKTVRLWDMETKTCLKVFGHNDYVTSIQFNPVDNRYFISASLDAKVRIWNIPDRQVVDWRDLNEMVTAACYTPDGEGAFVGTHKGTCKLYEMSDSKLQQKALLDLHFKKNKSDAKKITGFQFSPENQSEVLVTSADSQIRVYGAGNEMIHKFRGLRNTNSQTAAMFTPDGRYVVCASEDSQVYVWKREKDSSSIPAKGKTWVTTESYENFQCKDVSVVVPWPGTCRNVDSPTGPASKTSSDKPSNKTSPENSPLASLTPNHDITIASPRSPFASSESDANSPSTTGSKRPNPKKKSSEVASTDEARCSKSKSGKGGGSTNTTNTSWLGSLSSIPGLSLPSSAISSRLNIGAGNRGNAPAATAWGLVVVTAGLGGEIRVFQNFGMPLKLSR